MDHVKKNRFSFLKSRLARRFLAMFIGCALLPMLMLSTLAFHQVTRQLDLQGQRRLQQSARAYGMSIYERLLLLETSLQLVGSNLAAALSSGAANNLAQAPQLVAADIGAPLSSTAAFKFPEILHQGLAQQFSALVLVREGRPDFALIDHMPTIPAPEPQEMAHMKSGRSAIRVQQDARNQPQLILMRLIDPDHPRTGLLLGKARIAYLWGIGSANILPTLTQLSVLDDQQRVLASSCQLPDNFISHLQTYKKQDAAQTFAWHSQHTGYLAAAWSVFLKPRFRLPQLTVVLSHPKNDFLSPMRSFKWTFWTVVLLAVWIVLLLSTSYIRRTLGPLQVLTAATAHVAQGDFDHQVTVSSKDEFRDLATAFNRMAAQLGTQFQEIRQKERAIKRSHDELEKRVAARTSELAKSNQTLNAEVVRRKQMAKQLQLAKEEADNANQAKSTFLASMSHELRTPLNHIIGFSELLVDQHFGKLNATQEEYLGDVLASSRHLLDLINDILDLSKVEAGKLELLPSTVELRPLLENTLVMIKEKALKHGIDLVTDFDGITETIRADERKLKQILYNLLSNAAKFTPNGGKIRLSARRLTDKDADPVGTEAIEIAVTDTVSASKART